MGLLSLQIGGIKRRRVPTQAVAFWSYM
jgi:hypothetical protein